MKNILKYYSNEVQSQENTFIFLLKYTLQFEIMSITSRVIYIYITQVALEKKQRPFKKILIFTL